MSGINSK